MADTLDIVNESNDLEFELDNLIISGTIDLEDYYTKEQTDSLLQENYYNKQEVDDKLSDISSGESYTQGSGINISDDNVISIDNTVALKTDIPNTDSFVTESDLSGRVIPEGSSSSFGTNSLILISSNNRTELTPANINMTYDPTRHIGYSGNAITFRTVAPGNTDETAKYIERNETGASLRYRNSETNVQWDFDNVATKDEIPDTSTFVTTNTDQTINGSKKFTNITANQNLNFTSPDLSGGTSARFHINDRSEGLYYQNYGNQTRIYMDNIQTQIDGNTLESNLTTTNALNIGKAYLCNETSTSGTYVQGHVYKIGGTSGSYTATDITPTSSVDLSDYPTNEDLEGRVIPSNTLSEFRKDSESNSLTLRQSNNVLTLFSGTGGSTLSIQTNTNTYQGSSALSYNELYFVNSSTNTINKSGFSLLENDTLEYFNNANDVSYNLNDVQTQISGNNLEKNLTGTNTLNIGKVYTCISDSTSGTYKAGHLYLIGGSNGAYTTQDITPTSTTTYEEVTIQSTSWLALSDSSPYTYQATVTLTTTLTDDSVVELLNNQAVLFATYGFAIASISGQVATIYSIGQPTENVNLTMGVTA